MERYFEFINYIIQKIGFSVRKLRSFGLNNRFEFFDYQLYSDTNKISLRINRWSMPTLSFQRSYLLDCHGNYFKSFAVELLFLKESSHFFVVFGLRKVTYAP